MKEVECSQQQDFTLYYVSSTLASKKDELENKVVPVEIRVDFRLDIALEKLEEQGQEKRAARLNQAGMFLDQEEFDVARAVWSGIPPQKPEVIFKAD